jgi:hypothetical protein
MKTAIWGLAASSALILLAGCGLAANPQPPTAWLPQPVRDLSAARVGNRVQLRWFMPRNSTDKLALKGDQHAHICAMAAPTDGGRGELSWSAPSCRSIGDGQFAPDQAAAFTATLAPADTAGPHRALGFFVLLENHAGKTAGPSNPAWVATGAAPPAVQDLRLDARAEGVVLHWRPGAAQEGLVLRIHRLLVNQPRAPKANGGGAPLLPARQILEVDLDHGDPGQALDRDAALDHIWRYTVERVLKINADGHALEIGGEPSQPVTLDAKDTFPPAVPSGVAAVPDEQTHSIDLSWIPDSDADLAGYAVYRRDLAAAASPERISGKQPLVPPSLEDRNVTPGHRYAYSVSAIDRDGNESERSPEVEEELPQ